MGLGTISSRTNGQTIDQTWFNLLRTVLSEDLVPRNGSGVVTASGGSLGSTAYAWLYAYLTKLKLLSNSNYVTIEPPSGLAASYSLVMPPAMRGASLGLGFVTVDPSGNTYATSWAGMGGIFFGTSAPSGWLECDGSAISRTTYADLFTAIGTKWGSGDGSSTFNIPDLRGMFPRGWNHGKASGNYDLDASGRTTSATGSGTGDDIGSYKADAFKSHKHGQRIEDNAGGNTYFVSGGADGSSQTGRYVAGSAATANQLRTDATGDSSNETYPKNVYVMFVIKT